MQGANHHDMKYVLPGADKLWEPHEMVIRFDYRRTGDGQVLPGLEFRLASDQPVSSSIEGDLDYALMRLQGAPGEVPVENLPKTPERGYLRPVDRTQTPGDLLLIVQHPEAAPMKISQGRLTDPNPAPNRIQYDANTLKGSSGSPCLNWDWEPVALHRWGSTSGNRGVPFSAILPRIQSLLPG